MSASTERVAWFQCAAGTAGDMTLGALVAAGADPDEIAAILQGLGVDGWALSFERTQRCGIAATFAIVLSHGVHEGPNWLPDEHAPPIHHVEADALPHDHEHTHADGTTHTHDHPHADHQVAATVVTADHAPPAHHVEPAGLGHDHPHTDHDHPHPHASNGHDHAEAEHRPYRDIRELLVAADLPERVRERSLRVFARLAEVEGAMHGIDPEQVEFHEVGSLDAIVDIVGSCAALESLGIDRIECSPITVGQGTIRAAHGVLPNPSPAVVELLARAKAPARGIADHRELATPTGVALMTTLAERFGPMSAMTVTSAGFGAGTSDIPGRPNVVQAVIGERAAGASRTPDPGTTSQLFEANLDDATGEVVAHTIAALLGAGAQDAWVTQILMKKGRPAHTVHALCDPAVAADVAAALIAETGTLGLRASTVQRWPQARTEVTVEVDGHPIRIKLAAGRAKAEHDDAAAAAAALGLPLRTVLARAEAAATAG
jgi:uncharacterized protein (TIGR00299 family) protein